MRRAARRSIHTAKRLAKRATTTALGLVSHIPVKPARRERVISLVESLRPRVPETWREETFLTRYGPPTDGGYLIPDDLEGIRALFSPGIGALTGFDEDVAKRGIRVHAADGSIDPHQLPSDPGFTSFVRKHVSGHDSSTTMTLDTWVQAHEPRVEDDLMLQMDVEGDEFVTLLACSPETLKRFRILVVEVHGLHNLWVPAFLDVAEAMFQRLEASHQCVHAHANNYERVNHTTGLSMPNVLELMYWRRDRLGDAPLVAATQLPHPLDARNTPSRPDVALPSIW